MFYNQLSLFDEGPLVKISFIEELRRYSFQNQQSVEKSARGIPFFYNEFWTSGQRQAHSLHEISYRACFKPQLPEFFISRLTAPGETVYDPFMGRGTTPMQSVLMNRRAVGNDINPLSTFLARPRANPPTLAAIARRLDELPWTQAVEVREELSVFYHPETLRQICVLRAYLLLREREEGLDAVDDWIRMVATNRLTGHSPGFFSVYSLPPNQAVSISAQNRINQKREQTPPLRDVKTIILKKSRSLLSDGLPKPLGSARFLTRPADRTPELKSGSVDLVITSPPFLDIVQYAADNWLRCWFVGLDAASIDISMHRKPEQWTAFVHKVLEELGRIVRPGGHVAFEVGEVRNGSIELEHLVLDALTETPMEPLCVMVNVQQFTKTANTWGVGNNTKGTNSNRIVLARRV